MESRAWDMKQLDFDPQILEEIKAFRVEDLNDPNRRQNWVQVAKRFSRMKITPQVMNVLSYDQFNIINCIMSTTLGDMSRRTAEQRRRIQNQQEEISVLKHEQDKLARIYEDNLAKAKEVDKKLQRLQKQQEENDYLFQQMESQEPSKLL